MKLQTILPALAMSIFAVSAMAQSDPSVGGSFGNSFGGNRTAGKVDLGAPGYESSVHVQAQSRPSFWNRLTGGQSRTDTRAKMGQSGRSHGWFSPHPSNPNASRSRRWFGLNQNASVQKDWQNQGKSWFHHNAPAQTNSRARSTPASTHSGRWHIPFMSRS